MYCNLMNDEEQGSLERLKMKYRRGDQIIQILSRTGSTHNLCPMSLICRNLNRLRKVLINQAESIGIQGMTENLAR